MYFNAIVFGLKCLDLGYSIWRYFGFTSKFLVCFLPKKPTQTWLFFPPCLQVRKDSCFTACTVPLNSHLIIKSRPAAVNTPCRSDCKDIPVFHILFLVIMQRLYKKSRGTYGHSSGMSQTRILPSSLLNSSKVEKLKKAIPCHWCSTEWHKDVKPTWLCSHSPCGDTSIKNFNRQGKIQTHPPPFHWQRCERMRFSYVVRNFSK